MGFGTRRMSRRTVLGGIAGGIATLPFLRSFALGADDAAPKKLVILGVPNGPFVGPNGGTAGGGYEGWRPQGFAGPDFALPAVLPHVFEPLAPFRERLLFLEGVTGLPFEVSGGAHSQSACMLTGRPRLLPAGVDPKNFTATGISVDQYIAQQIGSPALSLAFDISGFQAGEGYWSYLGAEQPVTPIMSPTDAFTLVFGDGTTGLAAQRLLARRSSVLDGITGELQAMRGRVPAADRARLDAHLESVRALEEELASSGEAQCSGAVAPESYPPLDHANLPKVVRDHTDILVRALACGWTRVATLQLGNHEGSVYPRWPELDLESTYKYHAISHKFVDMDGAGSDGLSQADAIVLGLKFERMFSSMLADLLDRLTTTIDSDGRPMIENTLVVVARQHGENHNDQFILWTVAGGSGVGVSGGRFLQIGEGLDNPRYFNDVLTSMCHSMGVDSGGFGDTAYCGEPVAFS
jgi:hypothetical protein